jgi:hypothetical protein
MCLRLGATAQVQFNGIYVFLPRLGQRAAAAAAVAAAAPRASGGGCLHRCMLGGLACLHVVMAQSGLHAGMTVVHDSDWCGRISRSAECRQPAREATKRVNCACACYGLCFRCICMCRSGQCRYIVHGVGESDQPNRLHSDRKCIFCEFFPPPVSKRSVGTEGKLTL